MTIFLKTKILRNWGLILLLLIVTSRAKSQCHLDAKSIIAETGLTYSQPNQYFCINPLDSYFSIHHDYNLGASLIGLVNKENEIMISILAMPYPKPEGKINKYLIANVDMNHISKKALAQEMDTRISKMNLVGSSYLKKINADRGYIYNLKVRKGGYLGIYPRCKKVQVYKDNVGRAEILFFYRYGQDALVKQEIEKNWGMLKFKS